MMYLLLPLILACQTASAAPPHSPIPVGILLYGETGGRDWDAFAAEIKKSLGARVPFEQLSGPPDSKSLQKALDKLTSAKVERIAVLSVVLDTSSPESEQLRYLIGLSSAPAPAFITKWRAGTRGTLKPKLKVPVSIAADLSQGTAAPAALIERALALSRSPAREIVVVIGSNESPKSLEKLEAAARALSKKGGFKRAVAVAIKPGEKIPQASLRPLSSEGPVIVVPYLLLDDGRVRDWKKSLDGLFVRWDGKTLLPSRAIENWVLSAARGGR